MDNKTALKIEKVNSQAKTSLNNRTDSLIFKVVDSTTFINDILPEETQIDEEAVEQYGELARGSNHIYIVTSQTEIQLWKGHIRIPLSGGGSESWDIGVVNMYSITT